MAAGPDFSGPEMVVRKDKYKAAGIFRNVSDLAGKFKLILIIGLLSLSIMMLILISHSL